VESEKEEERSIEIKEREKELKEIKEDKKATEEGGKNQNHNYRYSF
jgi:hypothetical protein